MIDLKAFLRGITIDRFLLIAAYGILIWGIVQAGQATTDAGLVANKAFEALVSLLLGMFLVIQAKSLQSGDERPGKRISPTDDAGRPRLRILRRHDAA